MRKRVGARWGIAVGAAIAALAHLVYWYWPRAHDGLPSARAGALLDEAGWDAVLWIPYPHQNLALLERRVGDARAWFALLAGRERAAGESVPGFGPFLLPPSRELVVATAGRGERLTVELDVYPGVRWLARAAGVVARNPWLAGGEVRWGEGGRARVAWEGGRWRLVAGEPGAGALAEAGVAGRAFAQVRLGEPTRLLPAGRYRLVRGGRSLELLLGEPPPLASEAVDAPPDPPAGWTFEREPKRGVEARAAWTDEGALDNFPTVVVLGRGAGRRRLRVPGEEVLRLAGRSPETGREAGFEIRALSRSELERGGEFARRLDALIDRAPELQGAVALDPRALAEVARRMRARLQGVPLLALAGFDPGRLGDLLAPWERCGTSRLEVWRQPARVRWELCPERTAPN